MATPDYTPENEIPYGYCQCGCGQKTKPYKDTKKSIGRIKGEPARFLQHHGKSRMRSHEQIVSDFWSKIAITANDDLCWEWQAGKKKKGYGFVGIGGEIRVSAHRYAWIYPDYVIPEGMQVCHSCDNPSCCNPKHLFLGTNQDNVDDKVNKGRVPIGEKSGAHKMTNEKVASARAKYATGNVSLRQLVEEYGVTHNTMWCIIHNVTWKHVK